MLEGSEMVEQSEPLLPAETETKMPAARTFSVAVLMLPGSQSSLGGQPHELLTMSGAIAGLGLLPFLFQGARKNSKHSIYVLGRPTPLSMSRQAIHFDLGATPILLPPSLPTIVPMVCV